MTEKKDRLELEYQHRRISATAYGAGCIYRSILEAAGRATPIITIPPDVPIGQMQHLRKTLLGCHHDRKAAEEHCALIQRQLGVEAERLLRRILATDASYEQIAAEEAAAVGRRKKVNHRHVTSVGERFRAALLELVAVYASAEADKLSTRQWLQT